MQHFCFGISTEYSQTQSCLMLQIPVCFSSRWSLPPGTGGSSIFLIWLAYFPVAHTCTRQWWKYLVIWGHHSYGSRLVDCRSLPCVMLGKGIYPKHPPWTSSRSDLNHVGLVPVQPPSPFHGYHQIQVPVCPNIPIPGMLGVSRVQSAHETPLTVDNSGSQ